MLPDTLTLKYILLTIVAIWGVVAIIAIGRKFPGFILGTGVFLAIAYLALGSGFSIRIPYAHDRMEIIVYTVHENRVHALTHPLNKPGEPVHIVFSIDPQTHPGARMRKSFFDAVREREGKTHKTNIIVNMRGHTIEHGEFKYESAPPMPPKALPGQQ